MDYMKSTRSFPKLKSKVVLSPMAGVTDVAFRTLSRKYGAGLTYTEFVNSTGLVRGSEKAQFMIKTDPIEKPVACQLFGNSVDDVIEAARYIEDRFDIIDVNCGCPAWKVIKIGAGSEMLKKPEGIGTFINKLASSISKPVTLKIRSGITNRTVNAVKVAKVAEDAGAAAIAIHGRTQKQGYTGVADWDIIRQVKDAVNIPVIGNGDVFSPDVCKQRFDESGVDAIMIARGAIGKPFIFSQMNDYLKKGTYKEYDSIKIFEEYVKIAQKYDTPFALIKNHAMHFTKGLPGSTKLRQKITIAGSIQEIQDVLDSYGKLH